MAMREKNLNVSEKTWKQVNRDKYELGLKTHEDVILRLYAIVKKCKTANKLEVKKDGDCIARGNR